jgi:sugar phosphate permease
MSFQKGFLKYGFFTLFVTFFTLYFYATLGTDTANVLQPTLEADHGWTRDVVMAPVTIGGLLSIISAFVISTFMLKIGIKKILAGSFFILGLCHIWMANASTVLSYSISMIITQVFVAGIVYCSMALSNNWFLKLRGRFLGIVTCGAPVGTATFTPVLLRLVDKYGFPIVYTGLGVVVIIFGFLFILMVHDEPEEVGFSYDGEPISEACASKNDHTYTWTLSELLKTKETYILMFAFGFLYFMITAIMSNFVTRYLDVGLSLEIILNGLTVTAIASIPLSYFWGWLDDKIGTPKTCAIFSIFYSILAFFLLFSNLDRMIFVYASMIFVAFIIAGTANLHPSIVSYVYGRKEFINTNRYLGVVHLTFRNLSFYFMAHVYVAFGSYDFAYALFIAMGLLAAFGFFNLKKSYDPERLYLQKKGLVK